MKIAAIAFAWLTTLAITALSVGTVCYSVFGGVPQASQSEARDESPKLVRDRSMGSQFNRMLMDTLQSDRPRPARLEIGRHYNELVGCVINVAGVETDRQSATSREVAVELLGEIKSLHAVPVLVKHVDWQHDTWASEPNPYIGYMCAKSLRRYGFAAVPEILASLEKNPTSDKAVELLPGCSMMPMPLWVEMLRRFGPSYLGLINAPNVVPE